VTELLRDLHDRLDTAVMRLRELWRDTPSSAFERRSRLQGKIEGVELALGYLMESIRMSDENLDSDVERVKAEKDPLERARLATALMTSYEVRSRTLAPLRRIAIEDASAVHGMTYTEVAEKIGLSKGRVSQIRGGE
jgi:hypothetical protein